MAKLPATIAFNGRDINLWTADQLEVASKLNLKQRALNLRDLIGAEQLPPLITAAPSATIIKWLLEVQVMVCHSKGLPVEMSDFGFKPALEFDDAPPASNLPGHAHAPRAQAPFGTDDAPFDGRRVADSPMDGGGQAAYAEALSVAHAARQRNQGSFAFGGPSAEGGGSCGRHPTQDAPPTQMETYYAAAEGARRARERNQGSNIFG